MRRTLVGAALGVLVMLPGCGSDVGAGQNWIFHSYEQSSSDAKGTATKYAIEEAINIKTVTSAMFYPAAAGKDEAATLVVQAGAKTYTIKGKPAESIWRQMKSSN